MVMKIKNDCSCRAKMLAPTFWCPSTNKITGTQHHHKPILPSSCHIQRVLIIATEVEHGKIRVVNEQLLMITGYPIETKFTLRATSCHHQWYLFLLHWIIQSSIHLIFPLLVNSHPYLHITRLMITSALSERIVTERKMSCHHWWYLYLIHWMIQSLIHTSYPWFFKSHTDLHITQIISHKLLQYPVWLHLILQIPCHRRPSIM